MYQAAYESDLEKYGGELSVVEANKLLKRQGRRPQEHEPSELIDGYPALSAVAQDLYGECLPTLRLWFHYTGASGNGYVIGVVPDGVAAEYCYEFKAPSGNDNGFRDNRKMAVRQALLYSHAFERPRFKVDLARFTLPGPFPFPLRKLGKPKVLPPIERAAAREEVEGILDRMDRAISGRSEPTPAAKQERRRGH